VPTPAPPTFAEVLERMYQREGVDALPAHLAATLGVRAVRLKELDVGVYRVDTGKETPRLVARMFHATRPYAEAEGDLAVLRRLAEVGFPAERPYGDRALTEHQGQAVLITEFVPTAPKAKQLPHPIHRLGARIAKLHQMKVPQGADRRSGALHQYATGTMTDELRAAAGWLEGLAEHAPVDAGAVASLADAVRGADGGDGLPEAFVHPDPVPRNAILTEDGPVLVDWASAGRGPRLPSMAMVLRSGWAAKPFLKGYQRFADLTDDERQRLAGLLFSRMLIDAVVRVCHEPAGATSSAKRLPVLRREADEKAAVLLAL
jgi:Ser/Thr protein kinase RdoA (MazF antagonist)